MDNGQWTIGTGQSALDNRQSAQCDGHLKYGHWALGNAKWAIGTGHRAMDNGQWAMGNGQWAMDNGQ